jgi:nitroimidazol reductase NimA-like FMN-containing flavoprotein (pyridoxamine 5'-phosphate oxidase superfamily)
MEVNGEHYAVLQKHDDYPDDAYLFRVKQGQIVEIDDETEWENIAEAVDEMLYFHDFQ